MQIKKYQRWLLEIMILLMVFYAVRLWLLRDAISGEAPALSGITLQGQPFDLASSEQRPILVYFWASWCPVCKLQQDSIERIAQDYPVITVAIQSEDDKTMQQFMQSQQLSFAVINDQLGVLAGRYGVRGVPMAFIVDADNRIAFVESGFSTETGLRLRLWLAGL